MNRSDRDITNQNTPHPPRWASRLLSWYCRPALLEDLEGDLNEYFDRNVINKGPWRAKFIYIIDVLKFVRTYTIRKPTALHLLIQWLMIRSYLTTSSRSLLRNKVFSTINIFGLAISMSVGLLMISFVSDLLSYDDFHDKKGRIYRIQTGYKSIDNPETQFASTSARAGKLIKETISGTEELTIVRSRFVNDAHVGDRTIPFQAFWADESFFKIFTFPLLQGNPATALKEPYSLVLTEKMSKKLFGDETALGKSVRFDTVDYVVTGIMKDVPKLSHMQFEALASFSTAQIQNEKDLYFNRWDNIWSNYVYILVPPGAHISDLQEQLNILCERENKALDHKKITFTLQPLSSIALGKDLSNQIGAVMPISAVWIIGCLGLVVVFSACFNYTNLSIARSLRRSREVGIRKVIGALKRHVQAQFLCESILISVLALGFSFLIFLFLRPQFLNIAPELQQMVSLDLSVKVILSFIAFAVMVGIVAGFLPALFFGKINAVNVLKDSSSLRVFSNVSLRKVLIVLQYTLSLMFIATTVIGYKQYKNFLSFDLGFTTENVLNIDLQGNKAEPLIKELQELPEVSAYSKSLMITSVGSYWGMQMKYKNPLDSAGVWYNSIDENYLPLHGHKLLAGRNFEHKAETSDETEVIVNESLLKRFDISVKDPSKAIGEAIVINQGLEQKPTPLTIIGVLKDFHYGKADSKIDPVVFRYLAKEKPGYVNVKIASTDITGTLARIDKAWKKIDQVHPLDAAFYTDKIEESYNEISAMLKIIGLLSFLAICIASIGLFGMVIFTTETRLKEISIRKVLGANEGNLVYLLSKGFVVLLSIASAIALPATYILFDQVILPNITTHAPISLIDLLSGAFTVLVLAIIMIGSQTLKVAKSNPATVLKNE